MSSFSSVSALLDELAPALESEQPAWEDVLVRARRLGEPLEPPPRRKRRAWLAVAIAAAALVVAVATAFATGGLDRFSAWLAGAPGKPAPSREQSGFAHRNAASYASFPKSTKLRLLVRDQVGGKTFSLLGFRDADSLCLRLVRVDLPAARGSLQCVSLAELEQTSAPALVASDAWFRFGDPELSARGVYGFADDTVRRVEVVRERSGAQTVPVVNNVFLALVAAPSGSVAHHPAPDPITGVFAISAQGKRFRLAYTSEWAGTSSAPPKPPFYLGSPRIKPASLPGPAKAGRPFTRGTIGWLSRREPRGAAFKLPPRYTAHFGEVLFARAVQPDPGRPDRVALMLVKVEGNAFGPRPKTASTATLCFSSIRPLSGPQGIACLTSSPPFRRGQPLAITSMWPTQIGTLAGIAADAVAAIKIYLANGRVIPVPLRDNAFIVDVPTSETGKIVSFDRDGKASSVAMLPSGRSQYVACPRAVVPKKRNDLPPARPFERLDLATLSVNGRPILRKSVSDVIAALGRPTRILNNTIENGTRIPDLLYGGASQLTATTQIQFEKDHGHVVAYGMTFNSDRLIDARLGHILATQPGQLQQRITKELGQYRLVAGYGTIDSHGCSFNFASKKRPPFQFTVGLSPYRPSQRYLIVRFGY